jgi:hypothetical protein
MNSLREEIEHIQHMYGVPTDAIEYSVNDIISCIEKRIDSLFPHNPTQDSYAVGYSLALDKLKEMLKSK